MEERLPNHLLVNTPSRRSTARTATPRPPSAASSAWVGAWWPDGHIIGWEHTFVHQFAAFLNSIRDDTPSSPSFAEGLRVQRVLAAIEASSAEGSRRVRVAD